MQPAPTVYIVDDDLGIARELARLLATIGLDSEPFSSAEAFLRAYQPTGPGCLLLDVRMPGMSGLELQERLNSAGLDLPVIVITGHADVPMAVQAMKAGALDFLEKPFRAQQLCDQVQKAIRIDGQHWEKRRHERVIESQLAHLTAGEREVMHLVSAGKTNKVIAQQLGLSIRGIEARRGKMMKKLGIGSREELLELLGTASFTMG